MSDDTNQHSKRFFLPDFCHTQSVFLVILVAELLAILLSLARFDRANFWSHLAQYSLFIQWVALISAGCLCLLRNSLRHHSDVTAALISYALIMMVTFSAALLAQILGFSVQHSDAGIHWNSVLVTMFIAAILAAFWLRLFYLQAQYRLRLQTETEAKLQALQARIKPHFLFNSMNILSSLIAIKPEQAEEVVNDLSTLFRASLKEHREMVSLQDEIRICKHYFHIESLRLGDRLSVVWNVQGDIAFFKVPSLLLQPLVENAVYHGIQPLVDGGVITIDIIAAEEGVTIKITNPYDAAIVNEFRGHQVAVNNIHDRLALLYGEEFVFTRDEIDGHYLVTIFIPAAEQDKGAQ